MSKGQVKFKVGDWVKTLIRDEDDELSTRRIGEQGIIADYDSPCNQYKVVFETADEQGDYYWWYYGKDLKLTTKPTIA